MTTAAPLNKEGLLISDEQAVKNSEGSDRLIQKQRLFSQTIQAIRESVGIQETFRTTTEGLRHLLKVDRVAIYRFQEDWSGHFVAESHSKGQSSLLEKQKLFPAITENVSQCSAQMLRLETFSTTDTHLQQHTGGAFSRRGVVRVCSDVYDAGFSQCYIDALDLYEARAYMIGALHSGAQLWGLIAAYQSDEPRKWTEEEIELLEQISIHLGLALQQAEATAQIKRQTAALQKASERQKALASTVNKIRQSLDINIIFDSTTQGLQDLISADRVVIYKFNPDWSGEFVAESRSQGLSSLLEKQKVFPELRENVSNCSVQLLEDGEPNGQSAAGTEASIFADTHLKETEGGAFNRKGAVRICNDIHKANFTDCYINALEQYEARAYVISALHSGDQLWGLLAAFQSDGPRQWDTEEVALLEQVSNQLGIALQQVHSLETVNKQTAELKKAAIRQAALSKTIDKIRNSLDIDEIFETTTQEVRQLLGVERVAIYRFNQNWTGAFVADSIVDGWMPSVPSSTVIEDVFSRAEETGNYPRNEVFVPITQGEKLWGLLMAYQTSTPRYWEEEEVALLAQVGGQLAIALSQAELLRQTRSQTEQLNKALQDLRRTQAQMVQGEKMAGLGQLMAGIAHEINNPVSFVFSNAQPAEEQVNDLLALLRLYQESYPAPTEAIQEKAQSLEIDFIAEDLPKLIGSMKIGATRIRDIVQSMKVFSRMDEVDVKTVDVHQGIDSTLLILAHRMKGNDHRPEIQLERDYASLAPISCHPGQLNQVFMNLLSNAIEAFDDWTNEAPAPKIRIVTERSPAGSAVIHIIDNGPGIPEETLPNIFDPFFTTKPVGQGTGLGLSISYRIITEIHEGTLECHSSANGTIFRIELPFTGDLAGRSPD